MRVLITCLLCLPFLITLNLLPLLDLPKQLAAITLILLLSSYVFFRGGKCVAVSVLAPFWGLWVLFVLLSFTFNAQFISYSGLHYLVTISIVGIWLVALPTLMRIYGAPMLQRIFLGSLLLAGCLVGVIALLRYYGVLKLLLPLLEVDGERLVGPWGQPNLTGLLFVLALASLTYWCHRLGRKGWIPMTLGSIFFVYCGALTGSRAWLLMMGVLFGFPLIRALWLAYGRSNKFALVVANTRHHGIAFIVFLVLFPFVGAIDSVISEPLIESGFVNRQPAEEMLERQTDFSGNARLYEWYKVVTNLELQESAWFGHGIGRYGNFSQQAQLAMEEPYSNGKLWVHSHNLILMILVELGWVASGVLVICLLGLAGWLLRWHGGARYNAIATIVVLLVFQNMIEFSFWYLPFLMIFVSALVLMARLWRFQWSSGAIPPLIVILMIGVSLGSGYMVVKDYVTVSHAYINGAQGRSPDPHSLRMMENSPFLGYSAKEASIVYFNPPRSGLQSELKEVNHLVQWRPKQTFMLRKASAMAALGRDHTCSQIRDLVTLYPDTFSVLMDELRFYEGVRDNYDLKRYEGCALSGMERWL